MNILEGTSNIECLGLSFIPRDALLQRFVDKRQRVSVISSVKGLECEFERLVAGRRFLGEGWVNACIRSSICDIFQNKDSLTRSECGKVSGDESMRWETRFAVL